MIWLLLYIISAGRPAVGRGPRRPPLSVPQPRHDTIQVMVCYRVVPGPPARVLAEAAQAPLVPPRCRGLRCQSLEGGSSLLELCKPTGRSTACEFCCKAATSVRWLSPRCRPTDSSARKHLFLARSRIILAVMPTVAPLRSQRLNGREYGKGYHHRLPTEAEWEYAARAGMTGSHDGESGEVAWDDGNSGVRTHPVGQMRANARGLYDMLGNVHGWTFDWYRSYPGSEGEIDYSGAARVTRGGGWFDHERYIRSASHDRHAPGERAGNIGFRLVRTE